VKRRELIILLGTAAFFHAPTHAQDPGRIYRLGILAPGPRDNRGVFPRSSTSCAGRGLSKGRTYRSTSALLFVAKGPRRSSQISLGPGSTRFTPPVISSPMPRRQRPGRFRSSPSPTIWC